jgi:hypothetical protein
MALMNRDPFAREELHRSRVYGPGMGKTPVCDWCGGVNTTPKAKRPFLFRYWVESDSGRRSTVPGLFCSNACRAFYHV